MHPTGMQSCFKEFSRYLRDLTHIYLLFNFFCNGILQDLVKYSIYDYVIMNEILQELRMKNWILKAKCCMKLYI